MSTSHRPQLESRSGAKVAGYTSTSIEHARLLPGHKTIKYRETVANPVRTELDDKVTTEDDKLGDSNGKLSGEGRSESEKQETATSLTKSSKERQTKFSVNKPEPSKKGWRSGTAFFRNRSDKSKEKKEQYVNNLTKSAYHQDFMRKITK